MTDTWYLDIAAVRIQEWLGRTAPLRLRRGASALLRQTTAPEVWSGLLDPAEVTWNAEAGHVDGVVTLRLAPGISDPDEVLGRTARQVAGHLRDRMPALAVRAVAAHRSSYLAAHRAIEVAIRDGDVLVDLPPAAHEAVASKSCDWCHAGAAVTPVTHIDEYDEVCDDCLHRHEAAGYPSATSDKAPWVETRVARLWAGAHPDRPLDFPDDFRDLATALRTREDDADTQLALIYADGNRLGALLGRLADDDRVRKADVAVAVDGAVDAALLAALEAVTPASAGTLPIVPHVVAGDDVMVSVPASAAWPFVRTLLSTFGTTVGDAMNAVGAQSVDVSMSAAIVFFHNAYPFPDVAARTASLLREAKRHVRGLEASVAFLDLTADGAEAPSGRQPIALAVLEDLAGPVTELRTQVRAAARATLVGLLRDVDSTDRTTPTPSTDSGPAGRRESPMEAVARHLRLAHQDVWRRVLDLPPGESLDTFDDRQRRQLRTALDLARWWPPANDQEGES